MLLNMAMLCWQVWQCNSFCSGCVVMGRSVSGDDVNNARVEHTSNKNHKSWLWRTRLAISRNHASVPMISHGLICLSFPSTITETGTGGIIHKGVCKQVNSFSRQKSNQCSLCIFDVMCVARSNWQNHIPLHGSSICASWLSLPPFLTQTSFMLRGKKSIVCFLQILSSPRFQVQLPILATRRCCRWLSCNYDSSFCLSTFSKGTQNLTSSIFVISFIGYGKTKHGRPHSKGTNARKRNKQMSFQKFTFPSLAITHNTFWSRFGIPDTDSFWLFFFLPGKPR